jgi:hypothetical protein
MYHRSPDFRSGAISAINDLVSVEFEEQRSLAKTPSRESRDKAVLARKHCLLSQPVEAALKNEPRWYRRTFLVDFVLEVAITLRL